MSGRRSLPVHSISPLRFDPGTPFLDQHITDVYGEARCRVVSGSERAAVKLRVKNGKRDSREPQAGVQGAGLPGGWGSEKNRREVVETAGGRIGRAGRSRLAGMSDEASTAASRGGRVDVSFMAVGSLALAIYYVEASVAPAGRQTAEHGLEMPRPRP